MRTQWPCSKCGIASGSVICNPWISKEANNKDILDRNSPNQQSSVNNEEAKVNHFSHEISPNSTSISHENVALTVSQIGMIFGNLTFEPTSAIPLILHGKSLEPRVKSEIVTADDNSVAEVQHHFYHGKNLKPSTTSILGDSTVQIKQEHESEQLEAENKAIWDPNKVQKKKRSKLPQYTLSPLARFINQLRHAACYRRHRRRLRPKSAVVAVGRNDGGVRPKYDDVLIYERCDLYVPENEIGLGAERLWPTVYEYSRRTMSSSSTNESAAYYSSDVSVWF